MDTAVPPSPVQVMKRGGRESASCASPGRMGFSFSKEPLDRGVDPFEMYPANPPTIMELLLSKSQEFAKAQKCDSQSVNNNSHSYSANYHRKDTPVSFTSNEQQSIPDEYGVRSYSSAVSIASSAGTRQ